MYSLYNIWVSTLTSGSGLAVRACLAVLVCSFLELLLLPRLAPAVTLAVRAAARDVISIYLSICLSIYSLVRNI